MFTDLHLEQRFHHVAVDPGRGRAREAKCLARLASEVGGARGHARLASEVGGARGHARLASEVGGARGVTDVEYSAEGN